MTGYWSADIFGCPYAAKNPPFHANYVQGRLLQFWIAGCACVTNGDTLIAPVHRFAQRRMHAYLCGYAAEDDAAYSVLLQQGFKMCTIEGTVARLVDDDFTI